MEIQNTFKNLLKLLLKGRILYPLLHSVDPRERLECMLSATSTLAQLHRINPDRIGLQNFGKKTGFCKRVVG